MGAGGQDGQLLSRHLAGTGHEVHGGFHAAPGKVLPPGIDYAHVCDVTSHDDLARTLAVTQPDRIFYLAGQSSVGASFEHPVETWNSCASGLVMLLALLKGQSETRIVFAGSGECFGETTADAPATEASPFRPRSPYAAAKCAAHYAIIAARVSGLHACTAFLFSHESILRPETFVIGKVLATARRIADGSNERLAVGNVELVRDWGWAPDYVAAMASMSNLETPEDFVIATGESCSLRSLVAAIFEMFQLNWEDHVDVGAVAQRPADIATQHANPEKARQLLGWRPVRGARELAQKLAADLASD